MKSVPSWRPRRSRARMPLIRALARDVWQLDDDLQDYQLKAYRDHFKDAERLISDDNVIMNGASDVIDIVAEFNDTNRTIRDINMTLSGTQRSYFKTIANVTSVTAALKFAVHLWLFVRIDDQVLDGDLCLKQIIERKLPVPATWNVTGAPRFLADDVCEKSLTRKAGIKLLWTSNLCEHLEMVGRSKLKVFRHGSVLSSYASIYEEAFFPDGFLDETEQTIALLFPELNHYTSKRNQRISEKYNVDIESGHRASRDVNDYRFWGERLLALEKVYRDAKPKHVKQWYFDRRNKEAWTTFWIAVVVFVLTLFFGIISSVTGIMQVYIAFKAASPIQN